MSQEDIPNQMRKILLNFKPNLQTKPKETKTDGNKREGRVLSMKSDSGETLHRQIL